MEDNIIRWNGLQIFALWKSYPAEMRTFEYQNRSGGWLRMTRDADSNLLSIVNPRNRGITFRNDSAGRIVAANAIGSDKVVTFEYDDLGRLKRVAKTGLMFYRNRMIELATHFMEIIGWLPKRIRNQSIMNTIRLIT